MSSELAKLNEILKTQYLPGFTEQLNKESSYFYKLMEKKKLGALGAESKFLVTVGRNQGMGNFDEGENLPEAGSPRRKQVAVVPKNFSARIAISNRLIEASKGTGGFIPALTLQMEEILRDARNSFNRQLFGDGKGVLGTVKGAITGAATGVLNAGHYVEINQKVDILDKTTPTTKKATGVIVENVDRVTGDVTFSTTVTCADGDLIAITGSYGKEMSGLDLIMTPDNTLYEINRANNKWFNPVVQDLTGETLDDNYMEFAIQNVERESGKRPEVIISGYEAYRALKNYLSQFQRYIEVNTRYDAGHRTMSYDGIPVEKDRFQKETVMDFLSMEHFSLLTIGELFSFMDLDGKVLHRVPNKPEYEATLLSYPEVMCKFPKANSRLFNVTVK